MATQVMKTVTMFWLVAVLLPLLSLVSGELLDCSALDGAELQGLTGGDYFVYANDYRACVVDIESGECIALFQGDGRDFSFASRVTFDRNTAVYDSCWREVPGDVATRMATEYDFGQHMNLSMCYIETDADVLEASGFVNCSDAREFLVDEYDDDDRFELVFSQPLSCIVPLIWARSSCFGCTGWFLILCSVSVSVTTETRATFP